MSHGGQFEIFPPEQIAIEDEEGDERLCQSKLWARVRPC
jgi:hypothetical protein